MRRTIKAVLNAPGVEWLDGADGREALRLCCAHRPDWVLMDIKMPQMDGIEATREIHRRCPATRVVIVTNYDDPGLRAEAATAGACSFLSKEHLCDLRRILGLDPADAPHGAAAPNPPLKP